MVQGLHLGRFETVHSVTYSVIRERTETKKMDTPVVQGRWQYTLSTEG